MVIATSGMLVGGASVEYFKNFADNEKVHIPAGHGEYSRRRVLTMEMLDGDIEACIHQVFNNLKAVCEAAGGSLDDIVKLNVFLTDLSCFDSVNKIMATYFNEPYPARAAVGVAALPKGAEVEMDAILVL